MTPEDLADVILAEHDLPAAIERQRRYVAALSITLRSQGSESTLAIDSQSSALDEWRAAVDELQRLIDERAMSHE